MLVKGKYYTLLDVKKEIGFPEEELKPGGKWVGGYPFHNGAYYIFANFQGATKSGFDYQNQIIKNGHYSWVGKNNSKFNQPSIKKILDNNITKHLFDKAQRDPINKKKTMKYLGIVYAKSICFGSTCENRIY